MTMRRWALALLAATCVGALAVGAATAAPPDREPLLLEDFQLTEACPFPVDIEILANKEFVTFFSNGRILVTGKLFVRLTNADKPTNTARGAAHHLSRRAVCPKPRWTAVTGITCMRPPPNTDCMKFGLSLAADAEDINRAADDTDAPSHDVTLSAVGLEWRR